MSPMRCRVVLKVDKNEEENLDKKAPKINKIEVEETAFISTDYVIEDEFLKTLKNFRENLEWKHF